METVLLGNAGVRVSVMCLGTMLLGSREGLATSYGLLDQYVEAGGGFIDTANSYAFWIPGCVGGESEVLLGRWMKDRGNRKDLFIATKVGFPYPGARGGLTPNVVQSECEKSLKRLGTETIDLYYAHVDDRIAGLENTMEAFSRLVRAGKVRFIGASNFTAWRLEEARSICKMNEFTEPCCVQQRYSYLRPRPGGRFAPQVVANDEMLDYCRHRGLSLLAYSVLLGGAYTRSDRSFPDQYRGPDTDGRLGILQSVANELGATLNQVVYAWMIRNEPPIIPLIGASNTAQMAEALHAPLVKIEARHVEALNSALTGGTAW